MKKHAWVRVREEVTDVQTWVVWACPDCNLTIVTDVYTSPELDEDVDGQLMDCDEQLVKSVIDD